MSSHHRQYHDHLELRSGSLKADNPSPRPRSIVECGGRTTKDHPVRIQPYHRIHPVGLVCLLCSHRCNARRTTLAGRRFFLLPTTQEVHGGYSSVTGFHLWGCRLVARTVERLDRHRQGRENSSRALWPLFLAKCGPPWRIQTMQNRGYSKFIDDFWVTGEVVSLVL